RRVVLGGLQGLRVEPQPRRDLRHWRTPFVRRCGALNRQTGRERETHRSPSLVASGLAPLLGALGAPAMLTPRSAHSPSLVASGLAPLLGALGAPAMLTPPSAHGPSPVASGLTSARGRRPARRCRGGRAWGAARARPARPACRPAGGRTPGSPS